MFLSSLTTITFAQETRLVAPPGLDTTFGNDLGYPPTERRRVQYLYDSDYFSAVPEPLSVSGLAWRSNDG